MNINEYFEQEKQHCLDYLALKIKDCEEEIQDNQNVIEHNIDLLKTYAKLEKLSNMEIHETLSALSESENEIERLERELIQFKRAVNGLKSMELKIYSVLKTM